MACCFAGTEIAFAQKSRMAAMRCLNAIACCGRVVAGRRAMAAIVAFALTLVGAAAGAALAQDAAAESGASKSGSSVSGCSAGSSWERAESVLEVPPVYRSDSSTPADGCADDCAGPIVRHAGEAPIAVPGSADNASNPAAGTADTLNDESASADVSEPDDSAPEGAVAQQQGPASVAQQGADDPGASTASVAGNGQRNDRNDDQQQAEADRGDYVIQEAPVIIAAPIGAPIGSYGAITGMPAPAYSGPRAPSPGFPSASWMPRPVPGIAALPPMAVPRAGGGFGAAFPQMPGFAVGLGRR